MKRGGNFFFSLLWGEQKGGQLAFYSIFTGGKSMVAAMSSASDWWESTKSNFKNNARTFSKNFITQENIRISRLKEDCKTCTKKKTSNQWLKNCNMNFINYKTNKQKVLNLGLILDRSWRARNAPNLSSKYLVHRIGAKIISNWEQNVLCNVYVNRLESVIFGMQMCILQTRT